MRGDTIAAIATPRGEGGVAIIRISGNDALLAAQKVFSRRGKYESHRMYHGWVLDKDGARIDEAMASWLCSWRVMYFCAFI